VIALLLPLPHLLQRVLNLKSHHQAKYFLKHITGYTIAILYYSQRCVLSSVWLDDIPLGWKQVAVRTTNQLVLTVFNFSL